MDQPSAGSRTQPPARKVRPKRGSLRAPCRHDSRHGPVPRHNRWTVVHLTAHVPDTSWLFSMRHDMRQSPPPVSVHHWDATGRAVRHDQENAIEGETGGARPVGPSFQDGVSAGLTTPHGRRAGPDVQRSWKRAACTVPSFSRSVSVTHPGVRGVFHTKLYSPSSNRSAAARNVDGPARSPVTQDDGVSAGDPGASTSSPRSPPSENFTGTALPAFTTLSWGDATSGARKPPKPHTTV